jgi:hypothetical protein
MPGISDYNLLNLK